MTSATESKPQTADDAQQQSWRPLVLSFASHVLIIVLLFVLLQNRQSGLPGEPEGRSVELVLTEITEEQTEYLDESDFEPEFETAENSASAQSTAASESPPPLPELDDSLPGIEVTDTQTFDASSMATVPSSGQERHQHELSAEDLRMIARDQRLIRDSLPVGPEASISVFGSGQLTGRKFVFVLDRSNSMGAGGLGVLFRAESELENAVSQLESNHSFQIVAYNNKTTTLSDRRLLPADEQNKSNVPAFIRSLVAFGSTDHESGLIAALTFRPDVVILLTDGGLPELHAGHLDTIKRMAGRTQIHCIQFGSGQLQSSDNFMHKLAAENDGSYRYINVRNW
ncbi:MAG: VWA domain-containing protein [Planctomycetota bacterium]